jgi:hypothetical protein
VSEPPIHLSNRPSLSHKCKNNFVNDTYDKTVTKTVVKVSGTLGNRMVESPTLMDRWRITILGKPVLSLPIKETSEYPSY